MPFSLIGRCPAGIDDGVTFYHEDDTPVSESQWCELGCGDGDGRFRPGFRRRPHRPKLAILICLSVGK